MVYSILFFIITILVVVTFHEWGHYLAARLFSVRVERFSIGFGKVLWSTIDRHNTEWAISMIPLGGYVKPLAEPTQDRSTKEKEQALSQKKPWQRLIIFLAGPLFSLLLAVIIYTGLNLYGKEEPIPTLDEPTAGSLAQRAGLHRGDLVVAVDGKTMQGWPQVVNALLDSATLGGTATIKVLTPQGDSRTLTVQFPEQTGSLEGKDPIGSSGLKLKKPDIAIAEVIPDSPAAQAGLMPGDIIEQIKTQNTTLKTLTAPLLIEFIHQHPEQLLIIQVKHQGQSKTVSLLPKMNSDTHHAQIGALIKTIYPTIVVRYTLWGSVVEAFHQTGQTVLLSLKAIQRMISGSLSWTNLSGPISIANYAGQSAQLGVLPFLNFIALITISIGIFNLLPIPGLDGGQMVVSLVEMIRGKPVSDSLLTKITLLGYGILLMLMVWAFSLDLQRLGY